MRKIFLNILLLVNLILALALIVAYLSVYIPPDKYWIPSLFGMAYPFLLAGNLLFIVFWILFKPRYTLLSLVIIVVGWGYFSRFMQFKGKSSDEANIKVVSYNVKHFVADTSGTQKENAKKIISFLAGQNADIICLQEARLRKNSIFNLAQTVKDLESIKHYQFARSSTTYGSVTMTRYAIINMGEIRFEDSRNITIYTDVLIDADTVRIFNVHLQSYHIDPEKYDIIDSPGINQEKDLEEVKEMSAKFKEAFQLRAAQVREIRKYIDESPYNVILCGDFNDTPASFSYRKLSSGLNDAFVKSGKGIGRTYIGKLPSFRIDYILHGNGFESYDFQTLDYRMSDHLPISCNLLKRD
ncbi:endonuclease/exonuclease/phosphatase family protein [Draconibacterium sp. IB214405]|uniref:endonuclease/exonuclease/phosphatase family protein n=1 Tax=Draconibacterium sp. IB214405 TaxID=3097352 RepID=UPI002A182CC8|nr:endonuclease/exonuclease/phosphatase family protein [Draconibacterium sp. IB214405]MDX8341329.1 endonuclease/exonuclease/phosphatase family protein [Draconibacterium sp. IB214405]